ncbi:hypothetical protein HK098_008245, partial [Nowakowskiella sp. JEL0407]
PHFYILTPYWLENRLLQGSVLSPALFNVFINKLTEKLRNITEREQSTFFADDVAVIGSTLEQLREKLQ